jgi:DNA-binding GntR family transcriptional regulator
MAEQVAHALREAIATGRLRPGDHLVEQRIASELGVSRSPVREAIRRLELEGLIVGEPHRGARVTRITADEMRDLYAVRAALESLAGRLAAPRLSPGDRDRLRQLVHSMESAGRRSDLRKLSTLDAAFHEVIGEACGNRWLIGILGSLRLQIREFIATNLVYDEPLDVAGQHRDLVKELEEGSPEAFGDALEAHVAAAAELAVAGMGARGPIGT